MQVRALGLKVTVPSPRGRWNEHAVPVPLSKVPLGKGQKAPPRQMGLVERRSAKDWKPRPWVLDEGREALRTKHT